MLAKEEREMAALGRGCLGKAADDEPVFILRAHDQFAPAVVKFWQTLVAAECLHRLLRGAKAEMNPTLYKIDEAGLLRVAMEAWQAEHGCKIPD